METTKLLQEHLVFLKHQKENAEKAIEHHELRLREEKEDIKNLNININQVEFDLQLLKANK